MVMRRLLLAAVAAALLAPATSEALPADCTPGDAVVVGGPVIRWQGTWWLCTRDPRHLVRLPVPRRTQAVGNVVARGDYLAFSYDVATDCDYSAPGAMSVNRRTGAPHRQLAPFFRCFDIYAWYISDVALRPDTGAFAVIRGMADLEEDDGYSAVIRVNGSGTKVLDFQYRRLNERLDRHRILGRSLSFKRGRLRWRHAHGPQAGRL